VFQAVIAAGAVYRGQVEQRIAPWEDRLGHHAGIIAALKWVREQAQWRAQGNRV
jgi:hypothetical protein